MSSLLSRIVRGDGPPILLVHGSATDLGAWVVQIGSLADEHRVIAYHRRGTASAPLAAGERPTTADHAADAAAVLAAEADRPALVVGSSYGAVVAIELALREPARVTGLVLCEPPVPIGAAPLVPVGFGCGLEELAARAGGAAAAERFVRAVLGDLAFAAMPPSVRARMLTTWPLIQADGRALAGWSPGRAALAALPMPILLVGGDRSPPRFGDALDVLEQLVPRARRLTIRGAGHGMQIDQPDAFDRAVLDHARRCFAD